MASFVVLEPTDAASAERVVFVRDGFSLPALILPVVWLLLNKLWFEAALVLAATIFLGVMAGFFGLAAATPLLGLLVSVLVGFEGSNWRIAGLRRNGFNEKAVIEAHNEAEAELRYFVEATFAEPSAPLSLPSSASPPSPASQFKPAAYSGTRPSFGSSIGLVGHRGEQ